MRIFIGLEVHLHVKTSTKMFCRCGANIYGSKPNTHTCPVCLGLPGALPVANLDAIKKTQLLGIKLGCKLNEDSKFDRKHYFYPDLPKGYQISQYKQPLCEGGSLQLESGKIADIERIHLEEDTAKSFHEKGKTFIDFNKSGMPLIEIVTRPVFHSANECEDFCKQIQNIVRMLGIGDADMEKGQMRLEVNISMRLDDKDALPDYKVEVKNINSFRFMKKAIEAEIERQSGLLSEGKKVAQENRGFNEDTSKTVPQREKEEAHDYRYFPEPDIPPMIFDKEYLKQLQEQANSLQSPQELVDRYTKMGLTTAQTYFFSKFENNHLRAKYDDLVKEGLPKIELAKLFINKPETRELGSTQLKELIEGASDTISDTEQLTTIVATIISKNPNAIADYKKGKTTSIEFLIGQVMRETKGKANNQKVRQLIIDQVNG